MEVQKLLETRQQCRETRNLTELETGSHVWLEGKNLQVKGTRKLLPK